MLARRRILSPSPQLGPLFPGRPVFHQPNANTGVGGLCVVAGTRCAVNSVPDAELLSHPLLSKLYLWLARGISRGAGHCTNQHHCCTHSLHALPPLFGGSGGGAATRRRRVCLRHAGPPRLTSGVCVKQQQGTTERPGGEQRGSDVTHQRSQAGGSQTLTLKHTPAALRQRPRHRAAVLYSHAVPPHAVCGASWRTYSATGNWRGAADDQHSHTHTHSTAVREALGARRIWCQASLRDTAVHRRYPRTSPAACSLAQKVAAAGGGRFFLLQRHRHATVVAGGADWWHVEIRYGQSLL